MNLPFRYILTLNGVRYEATPLGVDSAKLRLEKDGENIFFRRKFSGSLIFVNTDFQLIYALETSSQRCDDVFLDIERHCNGEYRTEWQGVFSLNDVKWNLSLCTATVTPKPNDAYRCILDHYGKEYNILEVPATASVSASVSASGEFEFLHIVRGTGAFETRDDVATWGVFLEMRYWVDANGLDGGRYLNEDIVFRQVTTRPVITNDPVAEEAQADAMAAEGWSIIASNTTLITYGRPPALPGFHPYLYRFKSDFYGKYADLQQWNCGDIPDPAKYLVVAVNDGNGTCVNIPSQRLNNRYVQLVWEFGAFYFDRNRRLLDVTQFLIRNTCPSAAPIDANDLSDFLTLPVNYATGQPNKLLNLLIAQKTDIINSRSSEPAKKGMLSLKSLTENLRTAFNLEWFLNTDGKFQMEHISYFESQGETDLTLVKYQSYVAGKAIYEYDTEKMPRYEKLTFAEAEGDDFKQGVIEYEGSCVNYEEGQDTNERTVTAFTTDLNYLLLNGASANQSGFVLLVNYNGEITSEPGDLTGQILPNGHLSAANLLKHYHTYNRVLLNGRRNGKNAVFDSILKTKKQVPLTVPCCCDFNVNPFFSYLTALGSGQLQTSELNLKTQMVALEIVHDIEVNGTTIGSGQFDDSFNDSFL